MLAISDIEATYIKDNGLGGGMFWELSGDSSLIGNGRDLS